MPKWLLYASLAVLDFVAAYVFFARGRIIVPAILTLAGVCFVFACVGEAVKAKKSRA